MASATKRGRPRLDRRTRAARSEAADPRDVLLDAAAKVFVERGYRDASLDQIASRAGYSKGAIYWHFDGKEDLFLTLVDERVHKPTHEMVELLASAPSDQDMGPEASRRFVEVLRSERELLVLLHEYWSQAIRDPKLRARYAERQRRLRASVASALAKRAENLGAPSGAFPADRMATAILSLAAGLAQERLIDPDAVPDQLLGDIIVLLYAGIVARGGAAGA
jgi:AcrR family transcriptional regulator